jgi:MoaA/NifB/PqqE/SkfB family radical SAM enzyme
MGLETFPDPGWKRLARSVIQAEKPMERIELPVIQSSPVPLRSSPGSFASVRYAQGFHDEESEGLEPFRWMSRSGVLGFEPEAVGRFLELGVFSEYGDLSQKLLVSAGGDRETLELVHGWTSISLSIPPHLDRIGFQVSKIFPKAYYPADGRELAVRVKNPILHSDPARHEHVRGQWANAVLNLREMLQGETTLESTPPTLGIDLHGACNVKPPCVYCEWDHSKELEGENVDRPFTLASLVDLGEFFENAGSLQNCSVGEPFMMRNLDELLDAFGNRGKFLDMSTNGQILTERNVQKLLGRKVHLYVSLDAATAETYSRLRNDTFDRILENLRRLVEAKGGPGALPKVFLVFMPMRANVHELERFVKLCAELRVDRLVLRPLNTTLGNDLKWERAGYTFDYDREILPFGELVRVSGQARALSRRYGVALVDQLDFGGELESLFEAEYREGSEEGSAVPASSGESPGPASPPLETPRPPEPPGAEPDPMPSLGLERWPICTEPWKILYVLRRGVLPCSYGYKAIADMDGFRGAWNSSLLQEIRRDLGRGKLHPYCLSSRGCPILRKFEKAHKLPLAQQARLWIWPFWKRLNALTGGFPRLVLRGLRSLAGS